MAHQTMPIERSGANIDVYQTLKNELTKMEESPGGSKRLAVVLPTIRDNVEQELNERLNEVKGGPPERRLALIPYMPTKSHWIGIAVELEAGARLCRAVYLDPIRPSRPIPETITKCFARHFPYQNLCYEPCETTEDRIHSAWLTVQNMLKVLQEYQSNSEMHLDSNRVHIIS